MELRLLSCPLCLQPSFKNVDVLRSTLINVATTELSCPVCNDTLMGLDKLTIHLFSHITLLNSNNVINDPEPVPKGECVDKNKPNPDVKTQPDQISVEKERTEWNTVTCEICNFKFNDKNILEMHQKLLHQTSPDKKTGIYSYHCHLCSKKFRMKGSLMVHLRVAHYGFIHPPNGNEANDDSSEHDAALEEIPGLSKRAESGKVTNYGNKQWECDICSKMFTTKYFLKKHKRLHTGEMPYCCQQCNKSFTFQQSYHKHMLYHSSEKPHTCNECGRSFKELSTLQNHARIHSGERPFACESCGKRFRQRVSYLVHRRIHTGVMPYKCTACDKTFRYKVSQRSHKCPANPPGSVVRISDSQADPGKCILSVDYATGDINIIPENKSGACEHTSDGGKETLGDCCVEENQKDNLNQESIQIIFSDSCRETNQTVIPDLYSMVLSPLLPEVESLCLSNTSPQIENKLIFDAD